jgi:2-polyprenyl-3-methyl-5-hydroxy-6-metoxy-1,4-benzoquinol methylase
VKKIEFCDLCGGKEFEFLFSGHDWTQNIKGDYSLYRCTECGLFFINPQPTEREIAEHYQSHKYYSFRGTVPAWKKMFYKTFYSKKANPFLELVFFPLLPLPRSTKIMLGGRFLDVGCGAGSFLALMKYFNMDCHGVEPGKFDEQFAKENNLKIKNCTLLEANFPDNYFDVITLNHVFEHVSNPAETLRELHRILKPGGTLILAVPQSDCIAYKIFGRYWVQLDIPRHLFTFSKKTIKEYAKKTEFKIEKMRYNSTSFQFLGSFLYWANNNRKQQKYLTDKNFVGSPLFNFLLLPIAYICNFLKTGDQLEITLKK